MFYFWGCGLKKSRVRASMINMWSCCYLLTGCWPSRMSSTPSGGASTGAGAPGSALAASPGSGVVVQLPAMSGVGDMRRYQISSSFTFSFRGYLIQGSYWHRCDSKKRSAVRCNLHLDVLIWSSGGYFSCKLASSGNCWKGAAPVLERYRYVSMYN